MSTRAVASSSSSSPASALRPAVVGFGLALGFVLSRLGFTDWGELHRMLTFTDLRLVGAFGVAVVVTAIGLRVLTVGQHLPAKPFHSGIVPGALLFGVGWALSGACPGAALAQLGEGRLTALVSVVGVFVGSALYQAVAAAARSAALTSSTDAPDAPDPAGIVCT